MGALERGEQDHHAITISMNAGDAFTSLDHPRRWALAGLVNDREEDVHREAAHEGLNQDLVEGRRGLSRNGGVTLGTHSVSPESVLAGLRHSRLNRFVRLPQLSLSIASLFKIDNDISELQNLLLTFPRPHPLRSTCLSILTNARLRRYKFSDENDDLDKSIYQCTEAILLPFHTKLGSIECLREAMIRFPDLDAVRLALASSLSDRFNWAHSRDDYEEAMSILDELIADPNEFVELAMNLAGMLAYARLIHDSKPEHLAEAIFRTRTYLNAMSSENPERPSVMKELADLEKRRMEELGVGSGRQEDIAGVADESHLAASPFLAKSNLVEFPLPMPDGRDQGPHLQALISILDVTDRTNIEKGIEYCRLCLTSPHSHLPITHLVLGRLLYRVFNLTGNIDSLQQSITVDRDLIKMPGVPFNHHMIAGQLIERLLSRFELFEDRRDIEEIMELVAIAATDTRTDVPSRFPTSCLWTHAARSIRHPATLTAYQTAISLMQQSVSFAPTLAIQHFRLVAMRDEYGKLPLDYASYLIQIGQLKQAIETLERGRGLLWSEMRGLRASIDQLHAVNLSLAEKFATVNQDLEAVTISGSPMVWVDDGPADGREAMDPVGGLVMKQRKLVEERDGLITQIRAQPGFDTFLIPPSFDTLHSAAAGGPVILINHSEWRSDIIILLHGSPPSLIPTSHDFYDCAKGLHDKLLAAREKGLDSREYEDALEEVLKHLYDLVGHPVIQRLRELKIPEQSRVWWCPTSVFCSLPLHAMGPIPSNGPTKLYFSDIYIPSYTPTLSALIESRKPSTQALDTPSMLLVVQPDARCRKATAISTLERLKHHRFAHISCHGILETGKPFDAFFKLYEDTRLTLLDIVRSRLPTAEFAFLSACHTAEITEESIANEGLHLAAAVQYSGFRSVVGTMWAMADIDGPVLAESFYQSVFSDKWQGVPYYERTAEALRDSVRNLRRRRKMTLERWVNYVHYGA
ncbi:CHAT domain-containing protein [Russula compacta]|nr:CHAT domain-containing protein [Russula compacta]